MSKPILLFDGVCGLCDRLTQFLLKRDTHDRLLFASLQSEFAAAILNRHGKDTRDLDTVYVVKDFEQSTEVLLARSDAILFVLKQIGGVWSLTAVAHVLPKWLRDRAYNLVARNRYKVFGKHETCMLPEPKHRGKFLDVTGAG